MNISQTDSGNNYERRWEGAPDDMAAFIDVRAAGAYAVSENVIFDASATDPLTFVDVALPLAGVALPDCWVPAWRAAKVAR